MVENKPGYRWIQITDEQYKMCMDLSEPDTRSAKNQFESVSFVAGWCIESMMHVPISFVKAMINDPHWYYKALKALEEKK